MTFLAPGFLIAAGAGALVVVALHFLSPREPKVDVLPTTRFLPDSPVRATSTTLRPTDPWLLLLRVLLVLLAGAALAQPVLLPARATVARIVAVDVSRAVGDAAEVADSVDRYLAGAAAVIVFDSAAHDAGDGTAGARAVSDRLRMLAAMAGEYGAGRVAAADSPSLASPPLDSPRRGGPPRVEDYAVGEAGPWLDWPTSRGSLSASLLAARRAAARVRDRADSLELAVISPFVVEEYDAATERIRELWPGRVATVRVAAGPVTDEPRDSIRIEWADSVAGGVFGPIGDSADARDGDVTHARYWTAREPPDTIAAVRVGDVVLIHPFVRRWDLAAAEDSDARIIGRWADGAPAAIEQPRESPESGQPRGPGRRDGRRAGAPGAAEHIGASAAGCVRSFGFSLPAEGDVPLRPEFQRFRAALTAPCGEPRDFTPLPATVMASLAGAERPLAATVGIGRRVERATPLTPWLLIAAALCAAIELLVRRRGRGSRADSPLPRVRPFSPKPVSRQRSRHE
ncbi:MAG: BatA domain-containing protein, partial [Longimicrobiales bacterium]